ncbi:MAG: NAD-dependent epimerase/dehydratase family protein [bacterium]
MKILVTGGAGFIGSHIVDSYIELGHQVVVVDNLSTGRRENLNPQAEFHQEDIQDEQMETLFETHRFDVVNHQAAQMDVRRSVSDPKYDAKNNILGILNILQNCVKYGTQKFIFSSTGGAVYGEQDYFPADEEHPTWPVSPYGISKLAGEKYLYYYKEVHNLQHVILRYANVYGPRQNPHGEAGVVAIFTERLLKGEQPIINGDGTQTRDYVFVGDVVRANGKALAYEKSDIFNVGTGVETDVNEMFALLNRYTEAGKGETHGPAKPGEQLRSCLSFAKAEKILNWRPEVELKEGLRRTVEYFAKQKQLLTQRGLRC